MKLPKFSKVRFSQIYFIVILSFLFVINSGCTVNRRYHFSGLNIQPSADYLTFKGKNKNTRIVCSSKRKTVVPPRLNNPVENRSQVYNQKDGNIETILVDIEAANAQKLNGELNQQSNSSLINNVSNVGIWNENYYSRVKSKNVNAIKPVNVTTYVDTSDPEFWAIVFFILGLSVGVVSLLVPIKVLGPIALLLLLIGVTCAAFCDGDFYYSSTKILAIISGIILIIWGGANASIFDF